MWRDLERLLRSSNVQLEDSWVNRVRIGFSLAADSDLPFERLLEIQTQTCKESRNSYFAQLA